MFDDTKEPVILLAIFSMNSASNEICGLNTRFSSGIYMNYLW